MMQLSLGDLFTLHLLLFVLLIAYAWYRDERKHPSNDWTITTSKTRKRITCAVRAVRNRVF